MYTSVVIPAFNEENMIIPCLEALFSQTVPADEVILVDNNCTDATLARAQAFPVRVISEKRQGIIYARNAGFNAAHGDLILRIDADTRVAPTWIATARAFAQNSSADAFTGSGFFYDKLFGHLLGRIHRWSYFGFSWLYQGHHTLWGSNMAVRKTMWERVRNDVCTQGDRAIHEDVDLALHIARAGGTIAYCDRLLVGASGRRISSGLLRYTIRWLKNMRDHRLA